MNIKHPKRSYSITTRFFCKKHFHKLSSTRLKLTKNQTKAKQNQRLNFCYLKIIPFIHPRYHTKIIGDILKNVQKQSSQLGKKFDSKFLPSTFASSKAFRRQKFSCLFLLVAHVHDWIILHSYVEKHIFGKKTFYWPAWI